MTSPIPLLSTPTHHQTSTSIAGNLPLLLPQTQNSAVAVPGVYDVAKNNTATDTTNMIASPALILNPQIPAIPSTQNTENSEISIQQHSVPHPTNETLPSPPHVQMYDVNNPPIPISHLIGGNPYPSLNRVPTNIVQSFSPVYVQPQNSSVEGGDIYSDYVNNPYNLTLQEHLPSASPNEEQNITPVKLNVTQNNVFQSVNYFSAEAGTIPPGSEMLFGGP